MDPAIVAACIPGCERFDAKDENSYTARMTVAMAAITGTYDGTVTLSDIVPGTSYRLTAEGQGRPGFVKGSSAVTLRPDGAITIVEVSGSVQTGGSIARLGQRLVGSVSQMMLDRFFTCLQSKV
jgi:carbon monoxide dehydrogenase subunit G